MDNLETVSIDSLKNEEKIVKYQMVNEELKIAGCSIADLTLEQAQAFLKQWKGDIKLNSLTMFYEPDKDLLVLNRDNKEYSDYKEIAEKYLILDETKRRKILKEAPDSMKKTMKLMEECVKVRTVEKDIERAMKNHTSEGSHNAVLRRIRERFNNEPFAIAMIAFRYGVMTGKRLERTRRKRGTAS